MESVYNKNEYALVLRNVTRANVKALVSYLCREAWISKEMQEEVLTDLQKQPDRERRGFDDGSSPDADGWSDGFPKGGTDTGPRRRF